MQDLVKSLSVMKRAVKFDTNSIDSIDSIASIDSIDCPPIGKVQSIDVNFQTYLFGSIVSLV